MVTTQEYGSKKQLFLNLVAATVLLIISFGFYQGEIATFLTLSLLVLFFKYIETLDLKIVIKWAFVHV